MKLAHATVLIASDASIYQPTNTGAWASVVMRKRPDVLEPVEFSGLLQGSIASSTSAEMRGIANGLLLAARAGLLRQDDWIRLTCDNLSCVNSLKGVWRARCPQVREGMERVQKIVSHYRLNIGFAHIPGHSPKGEQGVEFVMNRRADELCGPIAFEEHLRRGGRPPQSVPKKLRPIVERLAEEGVLSLASGDHPPRPRMCESGAATPRLDSAVN